jgi:hypothetical protein
MLLTERVRYPNNWAANNGHRTRWLKIGARHAAAINAARRGDLQAVVDHGLTLGGLTQKKTFAKSAIKAAAKLSDDVPAYRIIAERNKRLVMIAYMSWVYSGDRQVAKIEWLPMWGVKIPANRIQQELAQ